MCRSLISIALFLILSISSISCQTTINCFNACETELIPLSQAYSTVPLTTTQYTAICGTQSNPTGLRSSYLLCLSSACTSTDSAAQLEIANGPAQLTAKCNYYFLNGPVGGKSALDIGSATSSFSPINSMILFISALLIVLLTKFN